MIRTYKRKLILSKEQASRLSSWIGACRVVYNLGMQIKNETYKATGKSAHKYALANQLPDLKEEVAWIKDVPSQSLQAALERLETSYQNFFRNFKKGGGYPKWASKRTYKSILFKAVSVEGNQVKLPKIGALKMFKDAPVMGKPKTATIIEEPTGFFVCIQCADVPAKFTSESQAIGLDMGVAHFCIDSEGLFVANPKHFKRYERKLCIANRSLARKRKGSNSWKRQAQRLAKLHHTIGNVRKEFLHKESTRIAKANSVVYVEKLNTQGMVRSASGTLEKPGKSVAAKSGLNKAILDCGWSTFKTMLAYKTTVVEVDPKYTSQMCSMCGEVDKKSRVSQSKYQCTSCGHSDNADVNAAKNIKSKGIAQSHKREPIGYALEPHAL